MSNNVCIYPACEGDQNSRGLCVLHYNKAYRLVSQGKTTWEKLVNSGRALLARTIGKEVEDWFVEGKKPSKIHRIREKTK